MTKPATPHLRSGGERPRERQGRPSLPDLPRPDFEREAAEADDALKQRLAELGRGLGFTRRDARTATAEAAAPTPEGQGRGGGSPAPAPPLVAAEPAPKAPMKTLQLVVPDYLFEQLHMNAARRRVTKKFLVLQALLKDGYQIAAEDLDEDGRRNR